MINIDKFSEEFRKAQEFNNSLASYLDENLKFGQKTPKEWKQYFFIKLPENIDFHNLIEINREIFIKYQQAAAYRDKETIQLTMLEQTKIDKYNTVYNDVRTKHEQKFNKGLAADSCRIAAELEIKDLRDAISNQKVTRDFWKSTCDVLTELRKLVEQMGYALASDAKISREMNFYMNGKEN